MENSDIRKFMKAVSFDEPWTKCYNYIEDTLEKVHRLETVSGLDMDTLISLFAAGYKLKAPELTIPPLCLSPLLKDLKKED